MLKYREVVWNAIWRGSLQYLFGTVPGLPGDCVTLQLYGWPLPGHWLVAGRHCLSEQPTYAVVHEDSPAVVDYAHYEGGEGQRDRERGGGREKRKRENGGEEVGERRDKVMN